MKKQPAIHVWITLLPLIFCVVCQDEIGQLRKGALPDKADPAHVTL